MAFVELTNFQSKQPVHHKHANRQSMRTVIRHVRLTSPVAIAPTEWDIDLFAEMISKVGFVVLVEKATFEVEPNTVVPWRVGIFLGELAKKERSPLIQIVRRCILGLLEFSEQSVHRRMGD